MGKKIFEALDKNILPNVTVFQSQSSIQLQLAPTLRHQALAILSLLQRWAQFTVSHYSTPGSCKDDMTHFVSRYNWHSFSVITTVIGGHVSFAQVRQRQYPVKCSQHSNWANISNNGTETDTFSCSQTMRDLEIQSQSSEQKLKIIDVLHIRHTEELNQVKLITKIFSLEQDKYEKYLKLSTKIFDPRLHRFSARRAACCCCTAPGRRGRRSSGKHARWTQRLRISVRPKIN